MLAQYAFECISADVCANIANPCEYKVLFYTILSMIKQNVSDKKIPDFLEKSGI